MKYRSRTDIVALILEATQEGAAKTKIMYKAFLSYSQLKDYLSILLERELIEYFDKDQIFRITDKGRRYLYLYSKVMELITPSDDQDLENQIK
jgi:predicted transcriptional regulator